MLGNRGVTLNIPKNISRRLSSTVQDFILNRQWNFPPRLIQLFLRIINIVNLVHIPLENNDDELLWKHSESGDLQLKEAYCFKNQQYQELQWAKIIWNSDIPPSKSLFVWRLMHEKVPTDENLIIRGCNIPSMCSLGCANTENSMHLFFQCPFSVRLWSWFAGALNKVLQFFSMEDFVETL